MLKNNKWEALSMKDRAFLMREGIRNGITDLNEIRDLYNQSHQFEGLKDVVNKVNTSDKDFAIRLRQEGRASIPDWEDPRRIATHKLGVSTDENGIHYIYPDVQNINGKLIDYSNPLNPHYNHGDQIAAERGDTIQIEKTIRDLQNAIKFTKNYKKLGIFPDFSQSHQFSGNNSNELQSEIAQETLDYFINWIRQVENAQKKGYNAETNTWTPHTSPEIGPDTIAYGITLNPENNPKAVELYNKQGYLTNEFVEEYVYNLAKEKLMLAKKTWDKRYPDRPFNTLPLEYQFLLGDKVYQVGSITAYPKLMHALYTNNIEAAKNEIVVKYKNKKGEWVETKDRNNKAIDTLTNYQQGKRIQEFQRPKEFPQNPLFIPPPPEENLIKETNQTKNTEILTLNDIFKMKNITNIPLLDENKNPFTYDIKPDSKLLNNLSTDL